MFTILQRRWIGFGVAGIAVVLAIAALNRFLAHDAAKPEPARNAPTVVSNAFPERPLGHSDLFWIEAAIVNGTWHQIDGSSGRRVRLPRGASVTLRGWAIDPAVRKPARAVRVWIDGHPGPVDPVNDFRPEVAAILKLTDANVCGFRFAIVTRSLSPGSHHLTFEVAAADGSGSYTVSPSVDLDVVAS